MSAGSLYLYDSKAAADLKTIHGAGASSCAQTKPTPEFLRVLTEVPGKVPTTFLFERGDHEQPTEAVAPAGLMIFESLGLGKIPAKAPDLPTTGRRLAFAKSLTVGQASAAAAGPDESRLAAPLRQGHRRHARRLRPARRPAHAPGVARLAGERIHGGRVATQTDAPADDDLDGLSASRDAPEPNWTRWTRTTACWAACRCGDWKPRPCATACPGVSGKLNREAVWSRRCR